MIIKSEIFLSPKEASNNNKVNEELAKKSGLSLSEIKHIKIIRKSIDARKKNVKIRLVANIYTEYESDENKIEKYERDVSHSESVIIIGSGPSGLFAAIELIKNGYKPIILERGKSISDRKKDIASIYRKKKIDNNSNYCFGEGGAGTFSDGKLYTRSNKRGNISEILEILTLHGADNSVNYNSRPHIGSDKLPGIISSISSHIIKSGGEIHYNVLINDFEISNNTIKSVISDNGDKYSSSNFILATGNSASDMYYLLNKKGIVLKSKPFAIGVRVEHRQKMIDEVQYHSKIKNKYLEAATYSLSTNIGNRGIYSFCMCPGGYIVPAVSGQDQIVVNGMSNSGRNSKYANSGIVVTVNESDFRRYDNKGGLSGLLFREEIEKKAWDSVGSSLMIPAQRINDFMSNKTSMSLPESSCMLELKSCSISDILPEFITNMLKESFKIFDKKIKGFISNEALLTAVESRTSSPVFIPRDKENFNNNQFVNLYPCGEGAGYAGGITSSALDGINVVNALVRKINK